MIHSRIRHVMCNIRTTTVAIVQSLYFLKVQTKLLENIPFKNIIMKVPSLVSVQWLAEAILKENPLKQLRILDGTWRLKENGSVQAKQDFLDEHIPGAMFFDIDECCDKTNQYPHMIPDEKLFAEYVQHLGMTLILYKYRKLSICLSDLISFVPL